MTAEVSQNNRDRTVDIMRGLGIIIMIYGHVFLGLGTEAENLFSIWYHAFHMPVFFVISGYFFSRKEINATIFLSRKAKHLLVPYVFWGMFHAIFNLLETGSMDAFRSTIIDILVSRPTLGGFRGGAALWFLISLFWVNSIYFFFDKLIRTKWLLWIITFIIGTCGMYLGTKGHYLPMGLDSALVGMIFMSFGDALKTLSSKRKYIDSLLRMKWYAFIILLTLNITLIFLNGEVNFRTGSYRNYLLTIFNACLGSILLWNFSRYMDNGLSKTKVQKINNALAFIGCNSIIYVCLNQRIILLFAPVLSVIRPEDTLCQFVLHFFTLIITIFICSIAMWIIAGNNRLKKIVGMASR